ncbi:MAG: hypothetical protein JNL09_02250 [Anaerolineales bacterium]|nr:hypothetical protein [Anaerolineales bacterium]
MTIALIWGSTPAERAQTFPCDSVLTEADAAYFRAVTVDAPVAVVFRWLCQLRVAPYSYDWIDNWGRPSPPTLTPGLENLRVGQTVMTMFRLASFASNVHVTLQAVLLKRLFGELAVSYCIQAASPNCTPLIVKLRVRYPRGPLGWLMRLVLPWGDWVMMRRQLLNLKSLAEKPQS